MLLGWNFLGKMQICSKEFFKFLGFATVGSLYREGEKIVSYQPRSILFITTDQNRTWGHIGNSVLLLLRNSVLSRSPDGDVGLISGSFSLHYFHFPLFFHLDRPYVAFLALREVGAGQGLDSAASRLCR